MRSATSLLAALPAVAAFALATGCSSSSKATNPIGPVFGLDAGADVATDHLPDAHLSRDAGVDQGHTVSVDAGHDAHAGNDATTPTHDAAREASSHDSPSTSGDAHADVNADASMHGVDASDAKTSIDASACPNGMGTLALLGGTSTLGFGATLSNGGTWKVTTFASQSVNATPALIAYSGGFLGAFTSATSGVIESAAIAAAATSWSAPSPLTAVAGMDAAATEQGSPSLVALGANAELVYYGSNSKFYHGVYTGSAWGAASDAVGGTTSQDFGPSQPTAGAAGSTLFVAWDGMNNGLYVDTWTSSGGWAGANAVNGAGVGTVPPTLLALTGGTNDLMLVYEQQTTNFLYYSLHTPGTGAGTWSPPAAVGTTALTTTQVALAELPNGDVVLVYEGSNGLPYGAIYSSGTPGQWTPPVALHSGGTALLASAPTVASGVCGVDAIASLVETTGVTLVTLKSGVWGPPVPVAELAGMKYATIATAAAN